MLINNIQISALFRTMKNAMRETFETYEHMTIIDEVSAIPIC